LSLLLRDEARWRCAIGPDRGDHLVSAGLVALTAWQAASLKIG
jgi:hypothetical protein